MLVPRLLLLLLLLLELLELIFVLDVVLVVVVVVTGVTEPATAVLLAVWVVVLGKDEEIVVIEEFAGTLILLGLMELGFDVRIVLGADKRLPRTLFYWQFEGKLGEKYYFLLVF